MRYGQQIFARLHRAGSVGNGSGQPNGAAPVAKPHFSYCFGGRPNTVYFSNVIESAPSINKPGLNAPFRNYLAKTFGAGSNDGASASRQRSWPTRWRGRHSARPSLPRRHGRLSRPTGRPPVLLETMESRWRLTEGEGVAQSHHLEDSETLMLPLSADGAVINMIMVYFELNPLFNEYYDDMR